MAEDQDKAIEALDALRTAGVAMTNTMLRALASRLGQLADQINNRIPAPRRHPR